MQPHMGQNDLQMFYKYLNKATNYLEYGSGGSTYQASIRENLKTIYSVESDLAWYNRVKALIANKEHINYIYCDMKALGNNWGTPGKGSTLEDWKRYSGLILNTRNIDYILIDGRFRVACCLKCFDVIDQDCLIAFDDFLNRSQYHIVLTFYEIVEKTTDNRMVILKKKNGLAEGPSQELIGKYESVFD